MAALTGPLLSLTGAVLVGGADFFAGTATRRLPAAVVATYGQAIAVPVLAVVLTATGSWAPPTAPLLWAVLAGALSALSLSAFYLALARGPMGLVAPVVSAAVAVPVVVGRLEGDRPVAVAALGLIAIAGGLTLAHGRTPRGDTESVLARRPVARTGALAVIAALGFGMVYVLLARAAAGGAGMSVLAFRSTSLTLLVLWLLVRRPPGRPARGDVPVLGAVGIADVAAGTAYAAAASTAGALLLVNSLLYNVYPLVTLALSRLMQKETLSARHRVAAAVTLAGVLLVVTG